LAREYTEEQNETRPSPRSAEVIALPPGPEDFRGRLFAVVPTPVDVEGRLHREGLSRLVGSMAGLAIGGVVVWSPIGRGLQLRLEDRLEVLRSWREGIGESGLVMASIGAPAEARRPVDLIEAARSMADEASGLGADALLVMPPGPFRGRPDRDRLVLEYHGEVAGAGLPLLVSYRREAAGGVAYGPETLAQLLARSDVLGVEIATIDGIATFQQVAALVREQAPGKLVISGEERFLGYSLLCGADAAMVGLGAAYPSTAIELIEAHVHGDASRFLRLTKALDDLGRPIFRAPMEGSVLRLLRAMAEIGAIPPEAANDPWGPRQGSLKT
jgi:4-hydroxy-tetrahydrodipicolinate synthase